MRETKGSKVAPCHVPQFYRQASRLVSLALIVYSSQASEVRQPQPSSMLSRALAQEPSLVLKLICAEYHEEIAPAGRY